jgi:hypothetical protein
MKFLGLVKQKCLTGRDDEVKLPAAHASLRSSSKSGYILPMVLVVALIGVLLGLGRLMMFKYQTQIRIDRQREIDRVLATRSALEYIEQNMRRVYATSVTNHFVYYAGNGREIDVTVRPVTRLLDSDLTDGWTTIADAGTELTDHIAQDTSGSKIAFHFSDSNTTNAICVQGKDIATTWLDYPWGLRFLVQPGVPYIGLENRPHTHAHLQMYIVGGELPVAGLSKDDIEQNPVIRIDLVPAPENRASPSTLNVYYSAEGSASVDAADPIMSHDIEDWGSGFGVQMNGDSITLFQRPYVIRSFQYLAYSTLDEAIFEQFDVPIRMYVGAQQVAEPETAFHYSVQKTEIRPPYEWDIELEWTNAKGIRYQEVSTVVHAVHSSGDARRPNRTITYDTHGTEAK